ncbi:DUF4176 domain-containing protein [Bacillus albus]|uniref:DUF4176 domain-containing protein n=1 Tax=Bacillus albus TaxID=2026189 RepID=A0A1J9ST48_9BACI|nr:DUF4176 domain-containing protein [Bacillus albus]PFB76493.1 DUF4176 domain-containing protein [Bacillus anthracis]PFM40957.1 DUF4176 domain-containing protein [Bacillus cereus]AZQ48859.1 DUF4176 domain-containing protein [Bacillus albus]MBF7153918.1 DUF4176 domain-containing protein [Bacillus albus]OJD56824.1 hypothetical protein BAU25_20340 [Bacillus albus]
MIKDLKGNFHNIILQDYIEEINQPLMIYGRKQQQADNKLWDYVSCPYPHGNLSKEYNVFFNHNQIIHLLFKGFETEDELELRSKLSEF